MRLSSSIHRRRAPLYNNERTDAMLDLKDFIHLPQLATLFDELAADAPGFVVVAGLEPRPLALAAAQRGIRVVAQLDTIFRGAEIARQLRDFGAAREQLRGPAWLIAVQRLPALCPRCKQPARLDRARRAELRRRCPTAPAG